MIPLWTSVVAMAGSLALSETRIVVPDLHGFAVLDSEDGHVVASVPAERTDDAQALVVGSTVVVVNGGALAVLDGEHLEVLSFGPPGGFPLVGAAPGPEGTVLAYQSDGIVVLDPMSGAQVPLERPLVTPLTDLSATAWVDGDGPTRTGRDRFDPERFPGRPSTCRLLGADLALCPHPVDQDCKTEVLSFTGEPRAALDGCRIVASGPAGAVLTDGDRTWLVGPRAEVRATLEEPVESAAVSTTGYAIGTGTGSGYRLNLDGSRRFSWKLPAMGDPPACSDGAILVESVGRAEAVALADGARRYVVPTGTRSVSALAGALVVGSLWLGPCGVAAHGPPPPPPRTFAVDGRELYHDNDTLVVLGPDGVQAFTLPDGQPRWKRPGQGILRVVAAGDSIVLTSQDQTWVALDLATGAVRKEGEGGVATAVQTTTATVVAVSDGKRLALSNLDTGAPWADLGPKGRLLGPVGDGVVVVFRQPDDSTAVGLYGPEGLRWRRAVRSRPELAGDVVVVPLGGLLVGLSAETGEVRWTHPGEATKIRRFGED